MEIDDYIAMVSPGLTATQVRLAFSQESVIGAGHLAVGLLSVEAVREELSSVGLNLPESGAAGGAFDGAPERVRSAAPRRLYYVEGVGKTWATTVDECIIRGAQASDTQPSRAMIRLLDCLLESDPDTSSAIAEEGVDVEVLRDAIQSILRESGPP